VVPRHKKIHPLGRYPVYEPVFLRYAAAPGVGVEVFEGFGLADSFVGVAGDGFNQVEDAQRGFPVRFHPPAQVFQKIPVENELPGRVRVFQGPPRA
jgi:hypothetical protein